VTQRLAVYPGSFDPITNGHLDILQRSLRLFDRVIIALADNVKKKPLFSVEERRSLIHSAATEAFIPEDAERIEVDSLSGLLIHYVQRRGAQCVVRGLRAIADFEFEFQLASMNHRLAPSVETVFLMTAEEHFYVSSSLIKEVAQFGGDVSSMVPKGVAAALSQRFGKPLPAPTSAAPGPR
jgi:pantetheine-phosphate adenylyltransferase